jgi:hypothetical protein
MPQSATVSVNTYLPATLVSRLDELRFVRQRRSAKVISRAAMVREIVERALAAPMTLTPAAPAQVGGSAVRERERRQKPASDHA